MRRLLVLALVVAALLAGHVYYWYWPRERAAAPAGAPLALLASGAYDVCLWLPYPHQNLGVLASAVGDLPVLVGAIGRLTGGDATAHGRSRDEPGLPTFGPLEVPPADELAVCTDLAAPRTGGTPAAAATEPAGAVPPEPPAEAGAAGPTEPDGPAGSPGAAGEGPRHAVRRLKVVARIYPALAMIAKLAGRLAGNPWLRGGVAGNARIAWEGRVWSVTEGADEPTPTAAGSGGAAGAIPGAPSQSLALMRWSGAREEIPAGFYALTRDGADLTLGLLGAGPAKDWPQPAAANAPATAAPPALIAVAGPGWHGGGVLGLRSAGAPAVPGRRAPDPPAVPAGGAPDAPAVPSGGAPGALAPAALALFETGSSRLSSVGDLPGLAVFNVPGAPGKERWSLPAAGVVRLFAGRLPAADRAGWHILALDAGSLRQAEALAPGLATLVALDPGAPSSVDAAGLSLGVWLDPPAARRMVGRIRGFVEGFPLASRHQVELWRDWETVLDPLAHCQHATLVATASPPSMRLRLAACAAGQP